jgi:ATP-dependent Clp protease adaptor protein ClpS
VTPEDKEKAMSIETIEQTATDTTVTHMPRWNVILLNTDHHTFEWVVMLIMNVFNKDFDEAFNLTMSIHKEGLCIAATCHKEKAEMYYDLVHGYGADPDSKGPVESLPCRIEPVDG